MKIAMFYHSLLSDWNHGNAHFLRGVVSQLQQQGHDVTVYEPEFGWSLSNMIDDCGGKTIADLRRVYPHLKTRFYVKEELDLDDELQDCDLVIVHEWNDHDLVARIGEHKKEKGKYVLLFHDTHHRSVSDPRSMQSYRLTHYDGVLAYGDVIRRIYLKREWTHRAWTWHEAADTNVFQPLRGSEYAGYAGDVVWIGNWGDEERTEEIKTFLIDPVRELGLKACVYGVRYPESAIADLKAAGIAYKGWLPNFRVPEVFAQYKVTIHIPRRPYTQMLPGIPTIRPFEAMACGIPLVSAPWSDKENLFTAGKDYLLARNTQEMKTALMCLVSSEGLRRKFAVHGCRTIQQRHTCRHRVQELLQIYNMVRRSSTNAQARPHSANVFNQVKGAS